MIVAAVIAVIAVTASLGFVAGRVTSPAQREAMAARPPVTPPTAKVELRAINTATIGRGTVGFSSPATVELPARENDVVTYAPLRRGTTVAPGDVLIELAGEPVFALTAPFSPYRDLRVGDSGRDVEALRGAMRTMGLRVSTHRLESAEISRLARFFKARGYTLPTRQEGCPEAAPANAAEPCTPKDTTVLPKSWWVGIATLPARVSDPGPAVGAKASASKSQIALSAGQPVIVAEIPTGAGDPAKGDAVTLEVDGGQKHDWVLASAKPVESSGQAGGPTVGWVLEVNGSVDPGLVAATGKLVIGASDNGPVVAVPLTAITASAASGRPAVRVVEGEAVREVEVELGPQADGWVAVGTKAGLREGELVLVG